MIAVVVLSAGSSPAAPTEAEEIRLLDNFEDIALWQVAGSDDVKASLRSVAGVEGRALCLDFDFGRVSGYATVRRELPLEYPENYAFSLDVRGDAPVNTLQFKLADASGENVWWVQRPDFAFPKEWTDLRLKKRHLSFAWGPAKDRELKRSASIEFAIVRGEGGGKGSVCFDRLRFHRLPAVAGPPPAPSVHASSTQSGSSPAHAIDGARETAWRSSAAAGTKQTLTIDFVRPREFGGLVLHWSPAAFASRYTIEFSDDGRHWRTVRRVRNGNGGVDPHFLPESETRYMRLRLEAGPAASYGLAEMEVKPLAYGDSANAFFSGIAREAPRGHYPRGFVAEQSYWTVIGVDGGTVHGLVSEDGALEIGPRSGSIEPFLLADDRLLTWADVKAQQTLRENYLPMPAVTWQHDAFSLTVGAFGYGEPARSQLVSHYLVENRSEQSRSVTLVLAVRPFQVNPPTQFLGIAGGVAPIRELSWDGRALSINGQRRIFPLHGPDAVILGDFDKGSIADLLRASGQGARRVEDDTGFATALLLFRLQLPPGGSRRIGITAPLTGAPELPAQEPLAWIDQKEQATAQRWREKLNRVGLQLPGSAAALVDTLRTALAHILISRSGAALQPGVRAYARTWVRDGAMMADALWRLGHPAVVREFIEWFAPHQFSSGKTPCCVDYRGADPVAENDSHGEWIYLVAQHYRRERDRAWLRRLWPLVATAAEYMNALRLKERTARNEAAERRLFYGLMPPSISHEGYADKPAYSYWDDFWSLAGYDNAIALARALGREGDLQALIGQREEFGADLHASLRASIARHGISYIPGSADRGDFDPTSTTVALTIAHQQRRLPPRELEQTFARYWQEFVARRDGAQSWVEYTPYELRNVAVFARLGWRERAHELLDFFMGHRRPATWNQWAEVVGREMRHPRFIGDMPHAWVSSDFISAVLDLFVYERHEDAALVLAAGVPGDWLAGEGVRIESLRTPYGALSYSLRREGERVVLNVQEGLELPAGGLLFSVPSARPHDSVFINGHRGGWENGNEVRLRSLPAMVTVESAS